MAKRKLSESQREAIRKELKELLRTAKTKAEALRVVAKKYGITTITARWYAKTLKGLTRPAPRPAASTTTAPASKMAAPAVRKTAPRKQKASRNAHRGPTGVLEKLVAGARATAAQVFARAKLAKQLLPKWQGYVRKETSLRNVERKVRQELRIVARKARALQARIKSLTSGR